MIRNYFLFMEFTKTATNGINDKHKLIDYMYVFKLLKNVWKQYYLLVILIRHCA